MLFARGPEPDQIWFPANAGLAVPWQRVESASSPKQLRTQRPSRHEPRELLLSCPATGSWGSLRIRWMRRQAAITIRRNYEYRFSIILTHQYRRALRPNPCGA